MPSYKAPVDDVLFLLEDVFEMHSLANLPGFAEATPDVVSAVLHEAAKLCEETIQPLNLSGDQEGVKRLEDGSVKTPKGFKGAYDTYVQGGWIGLSADPEFGGQGLPYVLTTAMLEFAGGANVAFSMYPALTMGALAAIHVHGSQEQKEKYLPKMLEGAWTGTMNLTEPHCGTDLGLLKTKAVPNGDGTYSITGQKIFISAGEHDLADNIIHLVLARIEGAPAGVKGISLFIVPKVEIAADGSLGARNGVSCGAVEHKMGLHANATCVMNFDGAKGVLIGQENRGLAAMFVMMNEARIGVAAQGLALSEVAYQNAAAYAKERLQGRSLSGVKAPEKAADPIIVHPDVRRNLLMARAFNEAARALMVWTSLASDLQHRSPDPAERQKSEDMLGLMTPVMKGVFTDRGFDNTVRCQQVFGGHGYIREWGAEQFVRDARIAQIYEGANGIQALDLVGRKLPKDGGRAVMAFFAEVGEFLKANKENAELAPFTKSLKGGLDQLQQATMWFMQNGMAKPDNAGAGASDYMHLFGLVAMSYMWARMAKAALAKKDAPGMAEKLAVGRFYVERIMPECATRLASLVTGADSLMALPSDAF
jgi:hypothetical protein